MRLFLEVRPLCLQVNSSKNHGILLKVVQVITDLNLIIKKAYIASDGGWFMDGSVFLLHNLVHSLSNFYYLERHVLICSLSVFNVTDQGGSKITDQEVLDYIKNVSHPTSTFCSPWVTDDFAQVLQHEDFHFIILFPFFLGSCNRFYNPKFYQISGPKALH